MHPQFISRPDIYVAGLGMLGLNHLTAETREALQYAGKIFHLSDHHDELSLLNPRIEDLSKRYWMPRAAWEVYSEIAAYVVRSARDFKPVVFLTNGNPMHFNDIAWEICRLGKQARLIVQALPAVSSVDVLPIQLGFDIGDLGTQIVEATQLVMFELSLNPLMSTLVLQIAEYAVPTIGEFAPEEGRFDSFRDHLCKFYPKEHPVVLIRSASKLGEPTYHASATIDSIGALARNMMLGMTMYIPRTAWPRVSARWQHRECQEKRSSNANVPGGLW